MSVPTPAPPPQDVSWGPCLGWANASACILGGLILAFLTTAIHFILNLLGPTSVWWLVAPYSAAGWFCHYGVKLASELVEGFGSASNPQHQAPAEEAIEALSESVDDSDDARSTASHCPTKWRSNR